MDGITMGFRKDLIPELQDDVQHSDPPVMNSGSRHQQRVVIKRDQTRVALRRFAGVDKALSLHECREMEREMYRSGNTSLSNLVKRLRGGQRKDVVAPKT
ncbi:Hypp8202 [Branchiostoma lanceolatum]|uniref:Hypp8202 protein n=1 Tax=Branchiostoma lanceolatum TaxID=7740 RepID=A0A8J9Z7C9_BRALA|nr:Hypp8202 [Branchiostoma lanceolatum]